LRLLRAERASGRASFLAALPLRRRLLLRGAVPGLPAGLTPLPCPLPFPLRGAIAEADGLALPTPAEGLDVWLRTAPFPLLRTPLLRAPFVEPETACVPGRLPLVFFATFEGQRVPLDGRAPLDDRADAGREDEPRVSEPERRAVRLLEEL
jgi:hypothetical protein